MFVVPWSSKIFSEFKIFFIVYQNSTEGNYHHVLPSSKRKKERLKLLIFRGMVYISKSWWSFSTHNLHHNREGILLRKEKAIWNHRVCKFLSKDQRKPFTRWLWAKEYAPFCFANSRVLLMCKLWFTEEFMKN